MDARQDCLSKTALKTVFISKCEGKVLITPTGEIGANINIGTTVSINVPNDIANSENDFTVDLSIELIGTSNEKSSSDEKETAFTMKSTLVGVFSVIKGEELTLKEIGNNVGLFSVQLFPVMRQHLSHALLDMNISAMSAPWDIGLGKLGKLAKVEESKK